LRWALTASRFSLLLLPEIQQRCIEYQYEGNAFPIIDGCTSQESDWFLDEALMWNMRFHVVLRHLSDHKQALDLGLFVITRQPLPKV
jgi:hypothetical protein